MLGIEDPVPRDCKGDDCDPEGGSSSGGVPATTAGKSAIVAGSENKPSEGGVGGDPVTPKGESGEGGALQSGNGGIGGETGGAPPQIECDVDERRCDVYQRQICISGHWMDDGPECPLACVDGECQEPPSCSAEAAVAPCAEGASCCETIWIPGGTYQMADGDEEDPETSYERTVSGFYLDRFEVTVSRFQYFQEHFVLPSAGAGAHPLVAGSGWQEAWQDLSHPVVDGRKAVPVDKADLALQLTDDCDVPTRSDSEPRRPINCVNWYVAFAFCAYDGGRLPTEAEWNYAAALGAEQRPYPWSMSQADRSIDKTKAAYHDYPDPPLDLPAVVGSYPMGRGGFSRNLGQGHDDLAGNVGEWTLDQWLSEPPADCAPDCVALWSDEDRVVRGGAIGSSYTELLAGSRTYASAKDIASYWGFRCARDIETSPPE